LSIAIAGLGVSLLIPMAYCRFGCPTGAVLGYARLHGRSDRFSVRDWAALALLAFGVALAVWARSFA
jgi:hypothetical protein